MDDQAAVSAAYWKGVAQANWCTCPPGWLRLNFGYHRGPKACPQHDIDQHQRDKRRTQPPAAAD